MLASLTQHAHTYIPVVAYQYRNRIALPLLSTDESEVAVPIEIHKCSIAGTVIFVVHLVASVYRFETSKVLYVFTTAIIVLLLAPVLRVCRSGRSTRFQATLWPVSAPAGPALLEPPPD